METGLSERLRNTTAVLMERFEHALEAVLENIADVNTAASASREIILKVKITPTNDRTAAAVSISSGQKLAAVAPFPVTVYIAKVKGRQVAFENNINQGSIFQEVDEETGEVKERLRVV